MAHKSPCSKARSVKFKCFPKIHNSFEMFPHKRVIITNNTTCFGIVLIVIKLP